MDANGISSILSGVMSNPEMMSKLQGILSDPQAMQTISKAASGFGLQNDKPKEEPHEYEPPQKQKNSDAQNRAALIAALKPYLNEERRDKADKLLSLLSLLSVSGVLSSLK